MFYCLIVSAFNSKNVLISAHPVARAPHVRPRPRPGEASERARVWFTNLLLPASQVVYIESTL